MIAEAHFINQIDEIFSCSRNLTLEYYNLEFPELRNYSISLRKLFADIGAAGLDDDWREINWKLRRIAFLLCAAPLDNKTLAKEISQILGFLEEKVENIKTFYPSYSENFTNLLSSAKALLSLNLDYIQCEVQNIVEKSKGTTAVLLKDSKLIPIVENNLKTLIEQNFEVISVNSLRKETCFDNLIVIGPADPRWYPDYVFASPRAKHIHVIKFRWVKGTWNPYRAFPHSLKSNNKPKIINAVDDSVLDEQILDPEIILPTFSFSGIIRKAEREFEENGYEIEYVDAVIGYLENEQIVFLDSNDNSKVRIIDIGDETKLIKNVKVRELEPDMFLLLRTSGGGNYIVPIADRIMNDFSENARNTQMEWKDRLRKLVHLEGMSVVVNKLSKLGCRIARASNVRNWMSYRSIKTSAYHDFLAIMKLVGLDDSAQEIWRQMELIHRAHIQAGFYISKLLLDVIRASDLFDLIRLGTKEYELPDRDAGSITAFRIRSLSSDTVKIPATKIGLPFNP